jgi:type VII secretion protein EssB
MGEKILQETVKKSELRAQNLYDYKWLTYSENYLLDVTIAEEKEEISFSYTVEGWKPISQIKEEELVQRLLILEAVGTLLSAREKYDFSLEPSNLYYDKHGMVKIKRRDIQPDETRVENDFICEYKAVIGYALQKKYGYEDYVEGGLDLLGKDGILGRIRDLQTVEEIQEVMLEEYNKIQEEQRKNKQLVSKKKFITIRLLAIFLGIISIGLTGYTIYHFAVTEPYKDASMQLSDAYLRLDYVACIDVMEDVTIEKMTETQKYMLAIAYVRSENLNKEQKENILSTLLLNDSTLRLEYWIYLGRSDVENAENIAMKLSDDQLLLYAYMREKDSIEDDQELTGEEKSSKLDAIEDKMQPLIEEYNVEEQ